MENNHKPFHQKYRPQNLDELVGQEFISITLKQALLSKKIAPAYLFNGPRGTGKTSSARIFAKSLNCLSFDKPTAIPCGKCELCKQINEGNALDIIEIDAASNTGVENIREIIERARFSPTQARWKVYVIDECHMLSTAASNALLKTIEEPPTKVVFILATTNPERVLTTIQSRCQKFDFKRISSKDIFRHILQIAEKESIKFEDQALNLIAKRSNGGMRDAQSLLDQLSLLPNGITAKNVRNLLGEVSEIDLINLINSIIENNPESLLISCNQLYDAGNEPHQIIIGLLNVTRDLLLNSTKNKYSELYNTSFEFKKELDKFTNKLEKSRIIHWHNQLKNIEYQIKTSDNPRLWLEIHLTSLLEEYNLKNNTNYQTTPTKQKVDEKQNLEKNLSKIELNHEADKIHKAKKVITENEGLEELIHEKNVPVQVGKEVESKKIENNELINKKNISENFQHKNGSNELQDKWKLILSKIELPSTRMLLSQQAELESINSNEVEISLSPNWENMIKSRKGIIENTLKTIFGDQIRLRFSSKQSIKRNPNFQKEKSNHKKSTNERLNTIDDPQNKPGQRFSGEKMFENSSNNLANFFNGEIIDIDE